MLLLRMDDWQYSITKDIQVMTQENMNRQTYILPKKENFWGIVISEQASLDQHDYFQKLVQDYGNLVAPQVFAKDIKETVDQSDASITEKIGQFMITGGSYIQDKLNQGGNYIAQKINQGGSFLQCHIGQPKPIQISDGTMSKVKVAKTVSNTVVTYSVGQVGVLVKTAKTLGSGLIGNSKKLKTVQKMKYFDDTMNVVSGAGQGAASVYIGMFGALKTIGSSIAGTTSNLISYKYGDQAGEIVDHATDVVGHTADRMDSVIQKNTNMKK